MNSLLIIASETKNFLLVLVWILLFVTTLTVVLVKHPVHCILSLVLVFIEAGFFLLSLNLDYLAFVFLIVYVGAIAVLFLFVTMMLNIRTIQINLSTVAYLPATIFLTLAVFFQIFYVLGSTFNEFFTIFSLPDVRFPDGCPIPVDDGSTADDCVNCLVVPTVMEWVTATEAKRHFIVSIYKANVFTQDTLLEVMFLAARLRLTAHPDSHITLAPTLVTSDIVGYVNYLDLFYSMVSVSSFAHCFYTFFYSSIFAAALVLLVAMVGSISLTLYYRTDVRRQAVYQQILREHYSTLKR